jgi:UDP-3-O-acyl-N-acetylglucosamine deacetylase
VTNLENHDLELAKLKITKNDISLVIVKNGQIVFETKKQGVSGFLQAIETLNQNLAGASVADKIVGVAAAMLCVYSKVSSVFALTVSESGFHVLKENNVFCQFEKKVENILNRDKTDVCPFEKLAISSKSPKEAYTKVKDCAAQMIKKSAKNTN